MVKACHQAGNHRITRAKEAASRRARRNGARVNHIATPAPHQPCHIQQSRSDIRFLAVPFRECVKTRANSELWGSIPPPHPAKTRQRWFMRKNLAFVWRKDFDTASSRHGSPRKSSCVATRHTKRVAPPSVNHQWHNEPTRAICVPWFIRTSATLARSRREPGSEAGGEGLSPGREPPDHPCKKSGVPEGTPERSPARVISSALANLGRPASRIRKAARPSVDAHDDAVGIS